MKKDYNELRCFANEIILQLFEAKQESQLEILKISVDRSLEELKKKN